LGSITKKAMGSNIQEWIMLLEWDEVRKILIETVCPRLVEIGFINPGKTMWRYRSNFIDVVHFYYYGRMGGYAIELGCHPRKIKPDRPMPWTSIFRTRVLSSDKGLCPGGIFPFLENIEEQTNLLKRIAPEILDKSINWFSIFTTIPEIISFMQTTGDAELGKIMLARRGSPYYIQSLQLLLSVK
jgi:hypothetical protein